MSPRSPLLLLLAAAALATPALADRLIVAGPDGFLHQADTTTGVFEPFAGPCVSPLIRMAADDQHLYGIDAFGGLYMFDLASGAMVNVLFPELGTLNSLAAGPEGVFLGTAEGLVARIDPLTGEVSDKRMPPDGVRVLLLHGGLLYAASTNGALYRAPAGAGEFEYFTCFCFFNIGMLAVDGGQLVLADEFGTVVRFELESGTPVTGFSLFGAQVAGVSDGVLLLYYDGGVIPLASAFTGELLPGQLQAPATVVSLLVLETREGPRTRTRARGTLTPP
ncbi:MAG TPA: hypothetical protein VF530_20285 [Planctomycetota bacterium]